MLTQRVTDAFVLLDSFTDYSILESPTFDRFHKTITRLAKEKPELPATQMQARDVTRGKAVRTYLRKPLVIKNALGDAESLKFFRDPQWWLKNYGDETVLCTSPKVTGGFSIKEFFEANRQLYVHGATALFERRPELKQFVDSDITRLVAPGKAGTPPSFYQLFMGYAAQGSTVHCAIGLNVFRQIAGRKRWYFFAPDQSPYVYPKLYENGFSATSKTIQNHNKGKGSPWFTRIQRYTVVLEPGDVLIVPPWWWHSVENVAEDNDLVIGVASRYENPWAALYNDPLKSAITFIKARDVGRDEREPDTLDAALTFEAKLTANRNETDQALSLSSVTEGDDTPAKPAAAAAPKRTGRGRKKAETPA